MFYLLIRALVSLLLFWSICDLGLAQEPEFTLQGDLPPIRATYGDLSAFVDSVKTVLERATPGRGYDPLSFQVDAENASLSGRSLENLVKDPSLPNPAYGFKMNRYSSGSSISMITIRLDRTINSYHIVGTDHLLLDSLKHKIDYFSDEHRSWFGGMIPIITVIFVPMFLGLMFLTGTLEFHSSGHLVPLRWIGLCLFILSVVAMFSGKIPLWFSMTAIYKEDASFLVRNNVQISFWLGFIGIVLSIFFGLRTRKQPESQAKSKE